MNRYLLSTLTLSLIAAFAGAAEPAVPAVLVSGISRHYMDPGVRPQDDFFTYLNGDWLKNTEIPADKSSWGTFVKMRDDLTPQLRGIIEAAQRDSGQHTGTDLQKIGDLYASFMDQEKRDALGYQPLTGELQRIGLLRDKKAIPVLMAHLAQIGVSVPYALYVGQDARASTRYAAHLGQSGLGLPDRDYYLTQDDAKLADMRVKYQRHIEHMLVLSGHQDAAGAAKAIVALETALAELQWSKVDNRDPVKRYNKMDFAQLAKLAPGLDWRAALTAAGVAGKTDYVIVNQPSYFKGLSEVLDKTELATWKAYFAWQLLRSYAPYLSREFVDANFAFYGTTITGVGVDLPRWKHGVATVEAVLGEALGRQYVQQYFPAERKVRMQALVGNLLEAYKQSIDTLDWMSVDTKREAQAKLAKFRPKIGYPNSWRDYSALTIQADDLAGNVLRAHTFAYHRGVNKLGQPIDREEWGMTPQTVNAYYNATMNEIVFPASILQPPFFDMRADDAVNYGAIGAVIGHEVSHGFDDKGSQFDGDGNLRNWWSSADRAKFQLKADALTRQYDGYSPLPGYHVNGALTLGENIGDLSGVAIAYKAYQLSLGGKPAPVIDGFTGDQRFFMGFGQIWRSKMREAQQIVNIKTDPHSPGQFRTNGVLINQPGFYDAFGVKEGDQMYVAPNQRITIW